MITENLEAQSQKKQPVRRLTELISLQLLREIFELGLIGFGFYGLLYWLPRGYFLDGNIRLHAIMDLFQLPLSWRCASRIPVNHCLSIYRCFFSLLIRCG